MNEAIVLDIRENIASIFLGENRIVDIKVDNNTKIGDTISFSNLQYKIMSNDKLELNDF